MNFKVLIIIDNYQVINITFFFINLDLGSKTIILKCNQFHSEFFILDFQAFLNTHPYKASFDISVIRQNVITNNCIVLFLLTIRKLRVHPQKYKHRNAKR